MAYRTKIGRRASTEERAYAAELVRYYRECRDTGAFSAEGRVLMDESGHEYRERVNPNILLFALQRFAEFGTFLEHVDPRRLEAAVMTSKPGLSYEAKIEMLMERFKVSDRTASRLIDRPGRRRRAAKP